MCHATLHSLSLALRDRERAWVRLFTLMITNIFIGLFVFFFSDLPSKHPSVKSTWKQIASLHVDFFSPCSTANHSLMTLKMWTIVNYSFELLSTDCRMCNKPKEHLREVLQHYIDNVLWPSQVSQQTTTKQGEVYIIRQYCANVGWKNFLLR